MTDINTTAPQDDDDLFTAATDTFPSKFDLKDRLVVIYPTGLKGQRQGENGKPYDWYETTTVVLDDGPRGWQEQVVGEGGELQDNLVPSVDENGPQVLRKFQWSSGGIASRLAQKLPDASGKPGSQVGRINSRPNAKKGMAPSWSIGKPTEEDMVTARRHRELCAAERAEIVSANVQAADENAF